MTRPAPDRDAMTRLSVRARLDWMRWLALPVLAALAPAPAHAQQVAINSLADVAFGTIANLSADVSNSQNVCVYSSTTRYSVKATGSGTSGAFTLSNGATALPYEVQWAASANQTSGTALTAGTTLSGLTSSAGGQSCSLGFAPTVSLIILLRGTNLAKTQAGNYTGTLSLLISPN